MTNDTIADMLTRLRNAILVKKKAVVIPKTKMTLRIAQILQEEGFIQSFGFFSNKSDLARPQAPAPSASPDGAKRKSPMPMEDQFFFIILKYIGKENSPAILHLEKISKPGRRIYVKSKNMPEILGGIGIALISTSKGILTDRIARQKKLGGEFLCSVY